MKGIRLVTESKFVCSLTFCSFGVIRNAVSVEESALRKERPVARGTKDKEHAIRVVFLQDSKEDRLNSGNCFPKEDSAISVIDKSRVPTWPL